MGWSFRRRIKIIPGVYLNVSKGGVSTTVGVRGASLTFRGDGTYVNAGIPGTGLSQRQKISGRTSASSSSNSSSSNRAQSSRDPVSVETSADYHFVSADPLEIVSPGLEGFQTAVIEANRQKERLKNDLTSIFKSIDQTRLFVTLSKVLVIYFLVPSLRQYLLELLGAKEKAAREVKSSIQSSSVPLDINMDDLLEDAYDHLLSTFKELSSSQYIWDVKTESDIEKGKLRSVASSVITRTRTRFSFAQVQGIDSKLPAFHLANTNGADIYIYPGFFVMYQNPQRLGIVDLTNLDVSFERTGFLETEMPPKDSKQLSEVWEKSNKDGTRDKRFADNRQLPVMEYGEITFSSKSGISEKYMISNCDSAKEFVQSIQYFISKLQS
jgi:hypothetical protein